MVGAGADYSPRINVTRAVPGLEETIAQRRQVESKCAVTRETFVRKYTLLPFAPSCRSYAVRSRGAFSNSEKSVTGIEDARI